LDDESSPFMKDALKERYVVKVYYVSRLGALLNNRSETMAIYKRIG